MRTRLILMMFLLSLSACTNLAALKPAKTGTLAELRSALRQDKEAGRLTLGAAQDVAIVVAQRDIWWADKPKDAIRHVQQVRSCARQLRDVLEARADKDDEVAPWAAMALLDAKLGQPDEWRGRLHDEHDMWRAVAARTLTRDTDGADRRRSMRDPDERVRLAAVRASDKAMDPKDTDELLEVARLDPNGLARVHAVQALGWLGNESVVLRMRDLWPSGDDALRQALVTTWVYPSLWDHGGRRQVQWVAETADGLPAVMAGGVLRRSRSGEGKGTGLATLLKVVQSGAGREKALAIAMLPLDDARGRKAIEDATRDGDRRVQLAAWTKLMGTKKGHSQAVAALKELAQSNYAVAVRAKGVLSRAKEQSVRAILLRDAKSPYISVRAQAGRALVWMGAWQDAVMLLADRQPDVREQVACDLLSAREP